MRRAGGYALTWVLLVGASAAVLLWLMPADAHAAEKVSEGRKIYDAVMRWVNFGILAFFFMKYGKPALMNFLNGERDRVQKTLHEIEKDLNLSKMRMDEEMKSLEGIEDELQGIRRSILDIGEKQKERILEDARKNASQMISEAKNELDFKMKEAKQDVNNALAEQAVSLAGERLWHAFTEKDNDKQLKEFTFSLDDAKKEHNLTL